MAGREPDLLRLVTCGSVDDGKSTLIGRLLAETGAVPEDLLQALEADSRRHGTCGEATDYALLVDGLAAEREQGITIDVAYRYFGTARRRFIVADSPGHVQYTRNMATAASTADLAVLLVDAEKGLLAQTRRHALIVALLGIRQVVLAVNKMDRVGWSEPRFAAIAAEFGDFAKDLDLAVTAIPLCARSGDNLVSASPASPWYTGPDLLGFLESVPLPSPGEGPLRLPVQWVCRPDQDFRGYAGPVLGGSVRAGDRVRLLPSGVVTRVDRLVDMGGDRPVAGRGESVMLTLADEVELGRGDMLCAADDPAEVADQFEADLIWFDESPMLPGRPYVVKLATASAGASFATLKHRLDTDTRELLAARTLEMNEIGTATLMLDRPLPFDPYAANRDTGSFIVIDRYSQRTVGAGMLRFALRRAHNIHWQPMAVDKAARSHQAGHRPCVIWLTGLSGSGKSTIADAVERELHARGIRTYVLDGDNIRHGLCRDLGFTEADRVENIRRVGEVARLMVDAGLVVITAFISPFRSERQLARSLVGADEFLEIFVDVPLEVAEARDPKGLYARARRGELPNFTGIDSPYEPPLEPDLQLPTDRIDTGEAARRILELLRSRGITGARSQ